MVKKIMTAACMSALLMLTAFSEVYAAPDYDSIYADSLADCAALHNELISTGSISKTNYNTIGYAYSDITGDGYKELIVAQVTAKHAVEYWIYTYDGAGVTYMGDFECDADLLYGYKSGILYRESYKGSVDLCAAEWNGGGFTITELYGGTYDRNGNPPDLWDLSAYFDTERVLDQIPKFKILNVNSYGNSGSAGSAAPAGSSSSAASDRFDLANYGHRVVVTNNSKGALVFQSSPNGSFMNDYQFWNGDDIYVNLTWRQDGYAIAYQNGVYGYVDAGYINWDVAPVSSDDWKYDLDNYGYRTVVTAGRGALVFQKSPNGSFMYDYEYWDGDRIYVNLSWRQDGYAIASQNGVYGYVDAGYIDWSSSGYYSSDRYDLANYVHRTVVTGGRGALVFQSSPNGSFMNDYQYSDGDDIYVNRNWRQDGYAIAYRNGVYGYVDAGYISW